MFISLSNAGIKPQTTQGAKIISSPDVIRQNLVIYHKQRKAATDSANRKPVICQDLDSLSPRITISVNNKIETQNSQSPRNRQAHNSEAKRPNSALTIKARKESPVQTHNEQRSKKKHNTIGLETSPKNIPKQLKTLSHSNSTKSLKNGYDKARSSNKSPGQRNKQNNQTKRSSSPKGAVRFSQSSNYARKVSCSNPALERKPSSLSLSSAIAINSGVNDTKDESPKNKTMSTNKTEMLKLQKTKSAKITAKDIVKADNPTTSNTEQSITSAFKKKIRSKSSSRNQKDFDKGTKIDMLHSDGNEEALIAGETIKKNMKANLFESFMRQRGFGQTDPKIPNSMVNLAGSMTSQLKQDEKGFVTSPGQNKLEPNEIKAWVGSKKSNKPTSGFAPSKQKNKKSGKKAPPSSAKNQRSLSIVNLHSAQDEPILDHKIPNNSPVSNNLKLTSIAIDSKNYLTKHRFQFNIEDPEAQCSKSFSIEHASLPPEMQIGNEVKILTRSSYYYEVDSLNNSTNKGTPKGKHILFMKEAPMCKSLTHFSPLTVQTIHTENNNNETFKKRPNTEEAHYIPKGSSPEARKTRKSNIISKSKTFHSSSNTPSHKNGLEKRKTLKSLKEEFPDEEIKGTLKKKTKKKNNKVNNKVEEVLKIGKQDVQADRKRSNPTIYDIKLKQDVVVQPKTSPKSAKGPSRFSFNHPEKINSEPVKVLKKNEQGPSEIKVNEDSSQDVKSVKQLNNRNQKVEKSEPIEEVKKVIDEDKQKTDTVLVSNITEKMKLVDSDEEGAEKIKVNLDDNTKQPEDVKEETDQKVLSSENMKLANELARLKANNKEQDLHMNKIQPPHQELVELMNEDMPAENTLFKNHNEPNKAILSNFEALVQFAEAKILEKAQQQNIDHDEAMALYLNELQNQMKSKRRQHVTVETSNLNTLTTMNSLQKFNESETLEIQSEFPNQSQPHKNFEVNQEVGPNRNNNLLKGRLSPVFDWNQYNPIERGSIKDQFVSNSDLRQEILSDNLKPSNFEKFDREVQKPDNTKDFWEFLSEVMEKIETMQLTDSNSSILLMRKLLKDIDYQERQFRIAQINGNLYLPQYEGKSAEDFKELKIRVGNKLAAQLYADCRYTEALEELEKVLELEPRNLQALYKCHEAHMKINNFREAKIFVKRIKETMQNPLGEPQEAQEHQEIQSPLIYRPQTGLSRNVIKTITEVDESIDTSCSNYDQSSQIL